jgi:hypothetical protein
MLAELVFVTRFLGLVAGEQNVILEADASVRSIELRVDGRAELILEQPPWKGTLDLGPELRPREVTAIAFDGQGNEVGRETQFLNVARERAELEIVLERDGNGQPREARLEWAHFRSEAPKRTVIRLDGRTISRTKKATLSGIDPHALHVLSAEAVFSDEVVARKELVFGGVYSEQLPANLTAVGVRQRVALRTSRPCLFRLGETEVAPTAVETGPAIVSFVLNGEASDALRRDHSVLREPLYKVNDAEFRLVAPLATQIEQRDLRSWIFPTTTIDGTQGLRYVVLLRGAGRGEHRFADAVAVAGVRSLGSNRRAVVYVAGEGRLADRSVHSPVEVRRYLESIGVPLRVWSTGTGPRRDLENHWGKVWDVSHPARLLEATNDLKRELEMQRVAWVPADPYDALRATTNDDCSYVPLARAGSSAP